MYRLTNQNSTLYKNMLISVFYPINLNIYIFLPATCISTAANMHVTINILLNLDCITVW